MPFRCSNVLNVIGVSGLVVRMGHLGESPGRHGTFSLNRFEQRITSHALVQEFEPGLLPFGTLAFSVKHAKNGLRDGNQFFRWNPIVKDVGRGGLGSESASNEQFEAWLLLGIEDRNDAEIVHDAQARVGFRTGKRDLEFAPHFLANRVPQKEAPQRICPREDIERFIRVQTLRAERR